MLREQVPWDDKNQGQEGDGRLASTVEFGWGRKLPAEQVTGWERERVAYQKGGSTHVPERRALCS